MASKINSSHAAGVIAVREGPFQHHSSAPHQRLSTLTADPPAIGINGGALVVFAEPISAATFRLGNITTNSEYLQVHHRLVPVIALVRDEFRQPILSNAF